MLRIFGLGKKPEQAVPPAEEKAVESPITTRQEEGETGVNKLKSAVSLTSKALIDRIVSLGKGADEALTEEDYEMIEETLIRADIGVDLAVEMTDKIRKNGAIRTQEALRNFLREQFTQVLSTTKGSNSLRFEPGHLNIYLIVGVNGAGKTTLIGKLANRFVKSGKKVVIAAGDTFRAAAEDQLQIWAERSGAQLVRIDKGDPAAVVFDSLQLAKNEAANVLIIDTAGRLQNKFNLMEELRKMKRIIEKEAPADACYESLLVIDATTGQNALRQAEVFHEAVELSGVALTKLDGSAKGGIVFNIAVQYHLPVKLVGVGEKIEDLRDFDPESFINALFEKS